MSNAPAAKKKTSVASVIVTVLVVLIALGALGYIIVDKMMDYSNGETNVTDSNETVNANTTVGNDIDPVEVELTVTAQEIIGDFAEDYTAAGNKYTDKGVEITGYIRKVNTSSVLISPQESFESSDKYILLRVRSNQDLTQFKQGDKIKASGKCTGADLSMNVILTGCTIEK